MMQRPSDQRPSDQRRMSERLQLIAPHSYRSDPAVPAFPDDKAVIVFDGVCGLCSGFVRFVAARDRPRQFRFIAAQSPLGQALFRHYGLDPVNYESNLLIADGRVTVKMDAVVGIASRLGGIWRLGKVFGYLPGRLADRMYEAIARNRYRWFGKFDQCIRPDASWRDRVIE